MSTTETRAVPAGTWAVDKVHSTRSGREAAFIGPRAGPRVPLGCSVRARDNVVGNGKLHAELARE